MTATPDQNYRLLISKRRPRGYWPLDSPSLSLSYCQDYRADGNLTVARKNNVTLANGLFSGTVSQQFNATNAYLLIGNPSDYGYTTNFTIEAWCYCTDAGTTNINTIMSDG